MESESGSLKKVGPQLVRLLEHPNVVVVMINAIPSSG
jgi:hypothetical protein